MKIFQVNVVYGTKSTGRIAAAISSELKKNGFECETAYGRGHNNVEDSYRMGRDIDVIRHIIIARLFDMEGYGSAKATEKLIEHIKEVQPDIIQLHNIHGYYVNIILLFKFLKEYNKPVVWTLHDCWAFTGHCAYFDYVQCDKWKTGCYKCANKTDYPKSILMDRSPLNYNLKKQIFLEINNMTLVTPSNWLKELVKKSFLKRLECRVIYNGIDLEEFQHCDSDFRKKNGIPENEKIILGVASNWSKRKGLNDFIELNQRISGKYRIVLVGIDKKQYKKLPLSIICIDKTDSVRELAAIYSTADVFVNPTYEDNFPTVNLEALACGTPVITYDTGGSKECLCEGIGKTVKKGDLDALEKAIESVTNILISRDDCRRRAEMYSKEKCYQKYIELYTELFRGEMK